MVYFIYLDIDMKCKHDFNGPTDSGDLVTSGHRVIPRWAWHIAGLWVGIHIIKGSPDDLVLFSGTSYRMQVILL